MDTIEKNHTPEHACPLEGVTQQQILTRLREATELAQDGPVRHIQRLRDVLDDLADRAAALELVSQLSAGRRTTQPVSLLMRTVLATAGGEPVSEFLLIPFGDVEVERPSAGTSFTFDRRHAESAVRWFNTMGRKLAIDYEHQSFDRFNTRPDGLRPAAGWIGGLEIREDGLWAVEVMWTDRAKELLSEGEYRYFSPVIFWTDEERSDVAALGPVALTNDPAMRGVPSLAASRQSGDEADASTVEVDTDASDAEAAAGESELVARADLDAAVAEVALLKKQLAAQAADTFVERGLRLGKIMDSTSMDWRADYLRDPDATEERLARAPMLLPPGRVLALNRRGEVEPLSAAGQHGAQTAGAAAPWNFGPEDLAAYDQAVAAGRVVRGNCNR